MGYAYLKELSSNGLRLFVVKIASAAARYLPVRLGYFFAECGGCAVFLFSAKRRNIVCNNIKRILALDSEKRGLWRTVLGVFKHTARYYFDLIMLSQSRSNKLEVKIEGWHHLKRAVASEKGTIIATAHLGNLDYAAEILGKRGIELSVLVEPYHSSPLRKIAELRRNNSYKLLPISLGAMRDGMELLRSGGVLSIVCDRNVHGSGLKMKFFGEETWLPGGAVDLALRTGATIVPAFSVREANRFVIHIEPPLIMVEHENRSQSVRTNLQRLVTIMERYIRQYPEQWLVLEPVWPDSNGKPC